MACPYTGQGGVEPPHSKAFGRCLDDILVVDYVFGAEQPFMRKLRVFIGALLTIYVVLLGALFVVMHRPVVFGQVMRHVPEPAMMVIPFRTLWFAARAGHLNAGDPAPGFNLPTRDRSAQVELASFRGQRPVVLVFGSYT